MRKVILAVALLCLPIIAAAQATSLAPYFKMQLLDNSGTPCAGCSIYSYSANTSTPLATFTDSSGLSQNTNPIVLDSAGRANIWLGSNSYKFVLKDASGVTIWTVDNVTNYSLLSRNNTWSGTQIFNGAATFNGSVTVNGVITLSNVTTFVNCDNVIDIRCYGGNGNGVADNTSALNNAVTAALAKKANTIYFPPGKFVFNSKPADFGAPINLVCSVSKGNAFGIGTQLVANYDESVPTNGFLTWTGASAATYGNGGGIQGCELWKGSGHTGGIAIKRTGADCTSRASNGYFNSVKISGDGTWNYAVYVDGSGCTTAGTYGLRDELFIDVQPFQTTSAAVALNNAVHFWWIGSTSSPTGGGVGDWSITGGGTATSNSTDVHIIATSIFGNLNVDRSDHIFSDAYVTGTCTIGSGATASRINNCAVYSISGSVTTANSIGTTYADPSVNGVAVNGLRSTGAILACTGIPSNLGIGDVFSCANTINGRLGMGADGLSYLRRNNGSGAGTQWVLTFDDLATSPFKWDAANGFTNTLNTSSKTYSTATNCNSAAAPAVCGSAAAGSVVIAAASTNVVVNTTAVTANSQILLTQDDSLGTRLGVTCNTNWFHVAITGRTAGTGFTIVADSAPVTNPLCLSYLIIN